MPTTTVIPRRPRPLFDNLTTDEEKFKVAMAEYAALKDVDADGLDFANKTAMWVAFERAVESQREEDDRLFNDYLAEYLSEPYGQRLSDAMSFGLAFSCFDPPGTNIGFGLEGHVMYTAARTKLINEKLCHWLQTHAGKCQVLNLGAGMDTRVYWMKELSRSVSYWEIDTSSVLEFKQSRLDRLKEKGELLRPFCERKEICMDFGNESIADLPSKHHFDVATPSCWILEGLIMYLDRTATEQLIDNLSLLSASNSFLILNFSVNEKLMKIEEIGERLEAHGWTRTERLMFGEEGFNFGRYPQEKPANNQLGFVMYQKL